MSAPVGTVNKINFGACESVVTATDITVSAVAARLQHIHIHKKAVSPCMMHGSGDHNAIRTKKLHVEKPIIEISGKEHCKTEHKLGCGRQ
jgi:hypothetical protein